MKGGGWGVERGAAGIGESNMCRGAGGAGKQAGGQAWETRVGGVYALSMF